MIGLMLAFGYNGNNDLSARSAPAVQTSGVVRAQDSANSNERLAKERPGWSYLGTHPSPRSVPPMRTSGVVQAQDSANSNESFAQDKPGWSYIGTWIEPLRSLALARRVSFAETAAPYPGVIGVKKWLPDEDSAWDTEVVKPFGLRDDSRSGEEGPFATAIALDEPFSVSDSENEKIGIKSVSNRDKDEVKKTTKRSVKKPQRRVTSRDRDSGFSPLQELQRAREKVRRVIRRIL
jgi:hypothetical protein